MQHENPVTFPHRPVITMWRKSKSCLKSALNSEPPTHRPTLRLSGNSVFFLFFSNFQLNIFLTPSMAARPQSLLHNKRRDKVSGVLRGISCPRFIAILQSRQQISRALLWRSYRGTACCFSHQGALHSDKQARERASRRAGGRAGK